MKGSILAIADKKVNLDFYTALHRCMDIPMNLKFTGLTNCSVPAENIISIEESVGFIEIQEKYPDFKGFIMI